MAYQLAIFAIYLLPTLGFVGGSEPIAAVLLAGCTIRWEHKIRRFQSLRRTLVTYAGRNSCVVSLCPISVIRLVLASAMDGGRDVHLDRLRRWPHWNV